MIDKESGAKTDRAVVSSSALRQPDWFALASCRGRGELFYPRPNERPSNRRYRELRATYVCRGCPAIEECAIWAREHREFGFWGGESEEVRTAAGYPPVNPVGRDDWARRPRRQGRLV